MSDTVKLASKLPADEDFNGLDAYAARLMDRPDELLVAVVWLDCSKVVENTDEGTKVPYARVRKIEPLGDAGDVASAVRDLVQEATRKRTGKAPVPFGSATVDEHAGQATIDEAIPADADS